MTFRKYLAFAGALAVTTSTAFAQDTYNVALDGTFAPHAMPKLEGGVEGFNVDLAAALGEQMGATLDVTAAQWSGLLPAMQAGTYDFLVAPTTVTEERSESMLFSEGYLNTDFQFVVKAGTDPVDSLEGFKDKVIAVNKGAQPMTNGHKILQQKLAGVLNPMVPTQMPCRPSCRVGRSQMLQVTRCRPGR